MGTPRRLIVGITGASGSIYGVRLLEMARGTDVETHLVMSRWGARTLAAIAHGLGDHLVHRAADVVLKERRKLVLAVREAPLHEIHLENMLKLSRMGVVIAPPVPAFYSRPETIDEIVNYTAARLLDQFGIHVDMARWPGLNPAAPPAGIPV